MHAFIFAGDVATDDSQPEAGRCATKKVSVFVNVLGGTVKSFRLSDVEQKLILTLTRATVSNSFLLFVNCAILSNRKVCDSKTVVPNLFFISRPHSKT